jgi:integrase
MLAGGVSVKELAEYLGHADAAFTPRVYARLLPSSHARARAVSHERFSRTRITTCLRSAIVPGKYDTGRLFRPS